MYPFYYLKTYKFKNPKTIIGEGEIQDFKEVIIIFDGSTLKIEEKLDGGTLFHLIEINPEIEELRIQG